MPRAEELFALALRLPSGAARDEYVLAQCASDVELRRLVESLLRAHVEAGDFLRTRSAQGGDPSRNTTSASRQGIGMADAAAHAEAFLRSAAIRDDASADAYVAELPEGVRREARERIEAGLRVRQLRAHVGRAEAEHEEPLPRVPGFQIERRIAAGGLGVVYAAHDEKLNRRVALKVLRRQADEQVRRRVLDEARKAAALGDPAVVTIYSVLDETDPPAIVMELVEGYPLDRFATQLNFEQKARLLREVARGLAAAHAHGLIHRDLKPENVLVGPDMRPRILDFGLALSLEEAGRQGRGFEGTPLYASPEQVRGQPLTVASDVFSFGSLMFKVLTGRPPFAGESVSQVLEAIATTAPPFLRDVAVGVPEDLQAICLACLAWEPGYRPTAGDVVVELGRFLAGEPVRLKPKLYDDLLRRGISEYSNQVQTWASQSIISREERDSLEVMHRRLLADEDHWIIDARRITLVQTILSSGAWLAVVATVLAVWMLHDELSPLARWLLPTLCAGVLLLVGLVANRERENLAAAAFLAGAALAIAPCTLSILAEAHLFATPAKDVSQLFGDVFTNQQVLASSLTALVVSAFGLWRLRMTGFAWTTAALATTSYMSLLLLFNWLERKPEIKACWCLPLMAMEPLALALERRGRTRWTLPFHLVALLALVVGLDVIAANGPTLDMLGLNGQLWSYLDPERQQAFSFVMNGLFFLGLMLVTERSRSLDLRRASKLLEVLAILHTLTALFVNATEHRGKPDVRTDVYLYLAAAILLLVLAPWRSRWRLLVGGLAGCGLGSYLLVDLDLVPPKTFIFCLGLGGLLLAVGAFAFLRRAPRSRPPSAATERDRSPG